MILILIATLSFGLVSKTLFKSDVQSWGTPLDLFQELNKEFGFMLDAATSKDNPLGVLNFYTKEDDGLKLDWVDPTFVNPPYDETVKWVEKAYAQSRKGITVVMLLAVRTDTKWFHTFIYKKKNVEIRFLKGRLKFRGANNSAPFPSMIVIFYPK